MKCYLNERHREQVERIQRGNQERVDTEIEFLEYIFNAFKIWVIVQKWESGLRVRKGKRIKLLKPGLHFKIPYFDSVYVQEVRLRIVSMPTQTITTKDGLTITLSAAIGYSITDIQKLYLTLFHPETTIKNMAMSYISDYISNNNYKDINLADIETSTNEHLKKLDYGIDFSYLKLTNFAQVRTYRLIQDRNWFSEGLQMTDKK